MASRPSLYKWKRQENTSAFASRGNVQQWVKQVQRASDDAARDIFGDNSSTLFSNQNVFVDDAAMSEAQDLLDSWIHKKQIDDLMAECDVADEKWSHVVSHQPQYAARDGMGTLSLGDDGTIQCEPQDLSYPFIDRAEVEKTGFTFDDEFDEEYAVQEVVHNMLGKDLVNADRVNTDIVHTRTKRFRDPVPKMELRHKQVKEKARERKAAWANASRQKMTKKFVEQEARKQVEREEKEQQNKVKREEEEIRKEMVKIRRTMQEEDKMRRQQKNREKEDEDSATMMAKEEITMRQKDKEDRMKREFAAKTQMKKLLLKQMEEDISKQKQEDLKLLHRCFSSWYAIVVNKRIKLGKARALSDWRRRLRAWNMWRTYVWRLKSDRETRALTLDMKERHRKEALADRFYHQIVCQRCLTAWLSYVCKEKQERKVREQHDERTSKMTALLKAAASGHLGHKSEEKDDGRTEQHSPADRDPNGEVEEIFLQPLKRQPACLFPSKENEGSAESKDAKDSKKKGRRKQAWPHEILRDMKTQISRQENSRQVTASKVVNTEAETRAIKRRSSVGNRNENNANISTTKTIIPESSPLPVEELSKSRNIFDNQSKDVMQTTGNNRTSTVRTSNTTRTESDAGGAGDGITSAAPSTARSTLSKVTSRKQPTKPLHLAMEERAKARADRKSQLEEKRREAEEQQLVKLQKEQEFKEKEIEAERQALLQKKREEKRIAKQREVEKQRRMEELRTLNEKADHHYQRFLVRSYGLRPWKRLVRDIEEKSCVAVKFSQNWLQGNYFREWLSYTKRQCEIRDDLANNFYRNLLLCRGLNSWKKHRRHLIEMHHIAVGFSKRYLVRKYLRVWQDYVIEERLLYWDKENRADEHNERRIKQIALTYWKKYIPMLREEEKREKRRQGLRKHVQSLLPDFRATKLNHSP